MNGQVISTQPDRDIVTYRIENTDTVKTTSRKYVKVLDKYYARGIYVLCIWFVVGIQNIAVEVNDLVSVVYDVMNMDEIRGRINSWMQLLLKYLHRIRVSISVSYHQKYLRQVLPFQ